MIRIVQTGGIRKMRIGSADLPKLLIHEINETLHGSAPDMTGQHHGRVIPRMYEQSMQELSDGHSVSDPEANDL